MLTTAARQCTQLYIIFTNMNLSAVVGEIDVHETADKYRECYEFHFPMRHMHTYMYVYIMAVMC